MELGPPSPGQPSEPARRLPGTGSPETASPEAGRLSRRTLAVSRARKRAHSGRWQVSAAAGCSAQDTLSNSRNSGSFALTRTSESHSWECCNHHLTTLDRFDRDAVPVEQRHTYQGVRVGRIHLHCPPLAIP